MKPVVLVKLGGSLITRKDRPDTARREVIARLAAEIAEAWPRVAGSLVLGHGSGSFGQTNGSSGSPAKRGSRVPWS